MENKYLRILIKKWLYPFFDKINFDEIEEELIKYGKIKYHYNIPNSNQILTINLEENNKLRKENENIKVYYEISSKIYGNNGNKYYYGFLIYDGVKLTDYFVSKEDLELIIEEGNYKTFLYNIDELKINGESVLIENRNRYFNNDPWLKEDEFSKLILDIALKKTKLRIKKLLNKK